MAFLGAPLTLQAIFASKNKPTAPPKWSQDQKNFKNDSKRAKHDLERDPKSEQRPGGLREALTITLNCNSWTSMDSCEHFGMSLGTLWAKFVTPLGSRLVTVGSLGCHFGISHTGVTLWCYFSLPSVSLQCRFGTSLKKLWTKFGISLESVLNQFEVIDAPI